ncbi:hypothetical protein GUITHDRAFT_114586 [Guillardia theta CCMP2712]|uniref:Uncharacterized protein n=1 Tax=Guillardia theta (strain CCMP2712) TaxID=905079 RepID=L1IT37_GUITC|nr:hypothetical protein GUITHDRAFT_114586 [Guillardia theta CCMP2712]EKX39388.1 hypothetical protein GUITHDRAFT_114586 [Guillardia theta CCMP2712]|eukprot:XP_005826368.1 hypothetical protein GUITHDRAFT_114586 [Guillardia theta CCMP2712]
MLALGSIPHRGLWWAHLTLSAVAVLSGFLTFAYLACRRRTRKVWFCSFSCVVLASLGLFVVELLMYWTIIHASFEEVRATLRALTIFTRLMTMITCVKEVERASETGCNERDCKVHDRETVMENDTTVSAKLFLDALPLAKSSLLREDDLAKTLNVTSTMPSRVNAAPSTRGTSPLYSESKATDGGSSVPLARDINYMEGIQAFDNYIQSAKLEYEQYQTALERDKELNMSRQIDLNIYDSQEDQGSFYSELPLAPATSSSTPAARPQLMEPQQGITNNENNRSSAASERLHSHRIKRNLRMAHQYELPIDAIFQL